MDGQRHYKMGYNISQNKNIDGVLQKLRENLIKEGNLPVNVIELGTYRGGMSFLLKDTFPESNVYTYDLAPDCDMNQLAKDAKVLTFHKDIFAQDTVEDIRDIIQQDGLTILFVDNGNKPEEFKLFSAFLKEGDIILAHDYAPDESYFVERMRDKIWNWFQISDADILDACINNSLGSYMDQEFISAAWVCKRKV